MVSIRYHHGNDVLVIESSAASCIESFSYEWSYGHGTESNKSIQPITAHKIIARSANQNAWTRHGHRTARSVPQLRKGLRVDAQIVLAIVFLYSLLQNRCRDENHKS